MSSAEANPQPRSGPPLRMGRPIWLTTGRRPYRRYPALKGRHTAEVAVVGGGMTGVLVAQAFAEAGIPIALLEAGRIGRGSTAASSALLLEEPDRSMEHLTRRYGRDKTRRIWTLSHDAVRDFKAMLRRLDVACDLVEQHAIYWTHDGDGVRELLAECRRRTAAGFKVDWLNASALLQLTGVTGCGGLRTTGNAQFDPYAACLGVAGAAARAGALLFEGTPVRRIDQCGSGVRLQTKGGSLDARTVIVATGYATPRFRPLAGRFRMYRTYVLVTPPVDRLAIGLGPVMLWDTKRPYHYARWTHDHRLVLGGGDRPVRPGQRRDELFASSTRRLRDEFRRILPGLATVPIERAWEGLFAMTPDSLPYVGAHPRFPRHLFALGYGGNGMTFGYLASRMVLEMCQGVRSPDHELFGFGRLTRT